ncbi:hypothetical protein DOY81_000799 [Sarcophaga bullata]|nr:hypothetical protein DOY81_000799 [Sarcophaga bullata]
MDKFFDLLTAPPSHLVIVIAPCYLIKKNKTLECEYVLCTANDYDDTQNVYVVIDVYAQIEPLRLAPYCIKQEDNLGLTFMVRQMEQVSPGYYRFKLQNCYIRKESNKKKYKRIGNKLRDLHKWQYGQNITAMDLDRIDNILATDYDNMPLEDKVYIGFTPYIYDFHTGSKVALGATTFTQPIYDSPSSIIQPNFGYVAGGSKHFIKLPKSVSVSRPILLQLTTVDSSWRIFLNSEPCPNGLRFILPSIEQMWQYEEEIRLFYLQFMDETIADLPKGRFKFIYIKER